MSNPIDVGVAIETQSGGVLRTAAPGRGPVRSQTRRSCGIFRQRFVTAFMISIPFVVLIGAFDMPEYLLMLVIFISGMSLLGGKVGLNALAGTIYRPSCARVAPAGRWESGASDRSSDRLLVGY